MLSLLNKPPTCGFASAPRNIDTQIKVGSENFDFDVHSYTPFTPGTVTAQDGANGTDSLFCTNALALSGEGLIRLVGPDGQTPASNQCGTLTEAECGSGLSKITSGAYFVGTDSRFYPCIWNGAACVVAPDVYYACHPLCVGGSGSGNGTAGFPSPPPPPPSPSPPARRELESDAKKSGAKNSRELQSGICTRWREGHEDGTLKNLKGSWNSAGKKNCNKYSVDECLNYYVSALGIVDNGIKLHMCEINAGINGDACVQGSYGDCVVDLDLLNGMPTCSGCPDGAAHLCEPGTSDEPLCVLGGTPTAPFPDPIPANFVPTCPTNAARGNWMQAFLTCTSQSQVEAGNPCECTVSNFVEQSNVDGLPSNTYVAECVDVPACSTNGGNCPNIDRPTVFTQIS